MCLAVPGRIVAVSTDQALRMGRVAFGPVIKDVCLAYVPEAGVDDYVIVHVGFAISRLDVAEAARTLAALAEVGAWHGDRDARAPEAGSAP